MATTPRGMPVSEAYASFRKGHFTVNRTYQRKLVWTLEEKKSLIDSMRKGYPVPLVLLLNNDRGGYDIIDGMQRLNAIFSFIENGFSLEDGRYFNVSEYPTAKEHADVGLFEAYRGGELLSRGECAELLNYQLAVTIFSVSDAADVTDIFGRINSGGRQLSPQERRQAGVTSQFATFVRRLGTELRGDVSAEVVNLSDMPVVSVDATSFKLGYGIKAEDTFWCRQGILLVRELRDSEDEQLVADLSASILLDEPFAVSREHLDEAYDSGTTMFKDLNDRIASYGVVRLEREIKTTLSVLQGLVGAVDPSSNVLRRMTNGPTRCRLGAGVIRRRRVGEKGLPEEGSGRPLQAVPSAEPFSRHSSWLSWNRCHVAANQVWTERRLESPAGRQWLRGNRVDSPSHGALRACARVRHRRAN